MVESIHIREIAASDILAKIERGEPVEYSDIIVYGDLDVGKLNLKKENEKVIIGSSIKIDNSRINGSTAFLNVIFSQLVNFESTEFNGKADFSGATFNGYAQFSGALFNNYADFMGAKFNRYADFMGAFFSGDSYFRGAVFDSCGDFSGATFKDYAYFSGVTFNEHADFSGAVFSWDTHFRGAVFGHNADFMEATFDRYADFMEATFSRNADFRRSRFENIVDFNAIFYGKFNLDESKVYSMRLSEAIFENSSSISLRFSDFIRLEVLWKSIRDRIEYDGSAYLSLAKNFNRLELFNDADDCYYHYRTVRRKEHLEGKISKILDYVAWIAYGYGVRPGNPLILSLCLFALSIFVYLSGFGLDSPRRLVDATYLSVFVFTSSPKTDPLTGIYGMWGMVERIAGWVLMACFLVVLAKKTLR